MLPQWVEDTANIIQIVSVVPLGAMMKYFWDRHRLKKEEEKSFANYADNRGAALFISIGGSGSESDVINYIRNTPELKKKVTERNSGELNIRSIVLGTMPESDEHGEIAFYRKNLIAQLEKVEKEFRRTGMRQIYLFYSGPAILAAIVGAEYSNRMDVICYHYTKNTYICIGPMQDKLFDRYSE